MLIIALCCPAWCPGAVLAAIPWSTEASSVTVVECMESDSVALPMVPEEVRVSYRETGGVDEPFWSRGYELEIVSGVPSVGRVAVSVPDDVRVTDVIAYMCQDPFPIGPDLGHTDYEIVVFDRRGIHFGWGHVSPAEVRHDARTGTMTFACTFTSWMRTKNRYGKLRVYYVRPCNEDVVRR
jgi:hypothetical protein